MRIFKKGLILVALLVMTGCAKDVGQDRVVQISQTIRVTSYFLTSQGLTWLEPRAPEEVPGAIADLDAVRTIALKYADGTLSVGDVASSLTIILESLNTRFEVVEGDGVGVILSAIDALSQLVSIYFVEATLPEEVGIYLNSFAIGIQDGLAAYGGKE